MNPQTLKMALSAASTAWGRTRDFREKKSREAYETLAEAAGSIDLDDLKGRSAELLDDSRREAGAVTKAARARLEKALAELDDRRELAQGEADTAKKAFRRTRKDLRKDASKKAKAAGKAAKKKAKKEQGQKRRRTLRNVGVVALILSLIAGLYYWFTRRPEPGTTPPSVQDFSGEEATGPAATLVYSTATPEGEAAPAGDLAEDPAERDEELLSALDEQLEAHRADTTPTTDEEAEEVPENTAANQDKTAEKAAQEAEEAVTREAEEAKGSGDTAGLGDLQAQGEELEDEFDREIGRNPDENRNQ